MADSIEISQVSQVRSITKPLAEHRSFRGCSSPSVRQRILAPSRLDQLLLVRVVNDSAVDENLLYAGGWVERIAAEDEQIGVFARLDASHSP